MGYYYIQTDEDNKIYAKSDLTGVINRENTYRISKEDYDKNILGKIYDVDKKVIIEGV